MSYLNGVFSFDMNALTFSASSVISHAAYGLAVDPKTDYIYCADPGSGTTNGNVYVYTQTYQLVDSFPVGFYPGGFLFN
jgi:DNA-binding beta-propeller fold protein YncE